MHTVDQTTQSYWKQATLPPLVKDRRLIGAAYSTVQSICARWHQCACHLIHDSLGAPHSPPQTAAQPVQSYFLADATATFTMHYTAPFPQKFDPYCGVSGPHLIHGALVPTTPNSVSIESTIFPELTVVTSGQTDWPINRQTELNL